MNDQDCMNNLDPNCPFNENIVREKFYLFSTICVGSQKRCQSGILT